MPITRGSMIGPYEVLAHIGAGGMGDVWRARDKRIGRDVPGFVMTTQTVALDERARRRSIGFLNWAHFLDHYVILIFPTVVIGLEAVYGRSYGELLVLSTAAFTAFGLFAQIGRAS